MSPIRTTSPSAAPARASARSTPIRRNRCCTYAMASGFVRSASATARSAGRPLTRHSFVPSRTTEKPCSCGRSTTNGSGSPSARRASSTRAATLGRAFDHTRYVGEHELVVLETDDAEVRFECRERIVGDLRFRRAHCRDECGLAGVRKADERGVREQLQLEAKPAFFAVLPL